MPDVATPSAPANAAPSAAPANAPATPAAPATAPANPVPAAPAVSPVRQALQSLPQNASWADAIPAIQAASAQAAGMQPAPATPPDTGQPRDELGRFASPDADPNAAPPEGAVPVSATGEDGDVAAPDGEEAQPEAEGEGQEPEPIVVKLTGRNGEELEFAVESEADADVLRQLKNDGMRRQEFERKSADLEKGFSQLREIGARMQADPEGFMIGELTPERQVSTARALLLNNWDVLAPEIESFWNDPVARRQALLDVRQTSMQRAADVNNLVAGYQAAREAERTIAGLIPETASEEQADAFFSDATAYLTGLAQQGRAIPANDIPQVLSRLVAAHGFGASAPAAAPAASTPQNATPAATPSDDPLAERKAKAAAAVRRLTRVAKQRQAAARVAPQGAGAAAVEAPRPPKGADIKQTTDFLKQRITRGATWSDLFGRRG